MKRVPLRIASMLAGLAVPAAVLAQPRLVISSVADDLGSTGSKAVGWAYDGAINEYVPMIWERGVGYTRVNGAFLAGTTGVSCSDSAAALAVVSENAANWGDLNCFNGFYWSQEDANNGHVLGTPRPAPSPCWVPGISHRWTAGTGWVNAGSLTRTLDPGTGRYFGGTRCDFDINQPNDLSGDGRYLVGGAWSAPLTSPSGGPGFGLCGDFFAFRYDSTTGAFDKLPVQPGTRTSRADRCSGDGSVITGYDLGVIEVAGPVGAAIVDLNFDGVADLAVANGESTNVSVLLGNGDGTFGARANYSTALGELTSLAVGDVNNDGNPDVLVTCGEGVGALIGDESGILHFVNGTAFAAGTLPSSVAVGSFNGDGSLDLAVANRGSNNVSVLLGNGDGTFQSPVDYAAGAGPTSVAVGTLNADGSQDLVVANGAGNSVSVLLGNGDGTFGAAASFGVGANPVSVAVGHFNAGGQADLAVANRGSNTVSVLLGSGAGAFGAATSHAVGASPSAVAVGNINGDGSADLVVANSNGNSVSVLLGSGSGAFGAAAAFGTGTGPASVAVGNLNAGTQPDLAVANKTNGSVSVLLGSGTGAFGAASGNSVGGGVFQSIRRTCVWRNSVQTILDPFLGAADNAAVNGPGTVVSQGVTAAQAAVLFPGQVGTRLVKWTLQAGSWVPTNLGLPAAYLDPDSGVPIPVTRVLATDISDDGNTIIGDADYSGLFRPFIWRPSLNGGVPMDLQTYVASIDSPVTPIFGEGFVALSVSNISADGNAILTRLYDGRNTCPQGFMAPASLTTFNSGVLYLDGGAVACDAPRIGMSPSDWVQDWDIRLGVSLNVLASGSWPMTYQWQREDPAQPNTWINLTDSCAGFVGSEIIPWAYEGTATRQLRIGTGEVGGGRGGRYRVVITNSCGTATSQPGTVTFLGGACCVPATVCTLDYEGACTDAGGLWQGVGSGCTPLDYCTLPTGACCNGTDCTIRVQSLCAGVYSGDNTVCGAGTCAATTGACCCGSSCTLTTAAACTTATNVRFAGVGTACNAPGNYTTPCCKADYNHFLPVPQASVQDIFDFLSGYFGGDTCADVNGTGGAPTVQDIFDFLSAYFGGGC